MAPVAPPLAVHDPVLPTEDLLGGGVPSVLAAAVEAAGGGVRSAVARQVTYQPGRAVTVRYDATLDVGGRAAPASMGVAVGRPAPPGALVLEADGQQAVVWQAPHDPWLPGLAAALDEERVRTLLADLGAPAGLRRIRLRVYRPGRRAVVEVEGRQERVFLKVVPPDQAERMHRTHRALRPHVPVPASLGFSPELGIVVLQALPGATLRAAFDRSHAALPGASALLAVLDRLPPSDASAPTAWRADSFAALLGAVAPELRERVEALRDGLVPFEEQARREPLVPVHGDFHEGQLLLHRGAIAGLLDVDTYGTGRRVDDLATMIGHLVTLAPRRASRQAIEAYARRLLDVFDRQVDPALLRAAISAVVLGLATGPFRVLEPGWRDAVAHRVVAAEQWLDSARRVAGR